MNRLTLAALQSALQWIGLKKPMLTGIASEIFCPLTLRFIQMLMWCTAVQECFPLK